MLKVEFKFNERFKISPDLSREIHEYRDPSVEVEPVDLVTQDARFGQILVVKSGDFLEDLRGGNAPLGLKVDFESTESGLRPSRASWPLKIMPYIYDMSAESVGDYSIYLIHQGNFYRAQLADIDYLDSSVEGRGLAKFFAWRGLNDQEKLSDSYFTQRQSLFEEIEFLIDKTDKP